ncbi:hypothetical protein [Novosphingobium huizhouense]|uniref:hypothetical protein n=1 Tax=Novosphingobium huizhouense TaxID=2866625 RepID=UPI001CD89A8B|nr:hypothetical protein [Novosphingobium huizhouense]
MRDERGEARRFVGVDEILGVAIAGEREDEFVPPAPRQRKLGGDLVGAGGAAGDQRDRRAGTQRLLDRGEGEPDPRAQIGEVDIAEQPGAMAGDADAEVGGTGDCRTSSEQDQLGSPKASERRDKACARAATTEIDAFRKA